MSLAADAESLPRKDVECGHEKSNTNKIKAGVSKSGWRRYAGIMFALLSGICGAFINLTTKILTQRDYHALNIIFWACQAVTLATPIFILYLWIVKKKNAFEGISDGNGKLIFLLLVRGGISFIGGICVVYSLEYLTVADATVIFASTPIVVTLFARIFLGERCGIIPIIVVLLIFCGVVVIARPPMLTGAKEFDTEILIGTALAFATTVVFSMTFVVIRSLRKVHFSLLLLSFGYVTSILALIFSLMIGVFEFPRSADDWILIMVGSAFACLLGQFFQNLSLKWEEAGPVALVRTLDIVFAFILQLIFFGVYPDVFSIFGAFIIASGVIATTCRKWLSTLSEEHPSRIRYSFMLK